MRTLWVFIIIIFTGAIITAVLPDDEPTQPTLSDSVNEVSKADKNPVLVVPPTPKMMDEDPDPALALADELAQSAKITDRNPTGADSTPSEESDQPDSKSAGDLLTIGMDRSITSATVLQGNIRRVGPDELEVDEEFTLEGDGSEENPYRPSWEYLYSAGDTYAPRLGKNEIPQRIALLDGMWVKISGYTVFPLVSGQTTELLVMLNQWDGCCIGVPPTPFDAIEVGLNDPVTRGPKHGLTYGTLTGRLKVDPYLIEDWLVGLYLLEEASLEAGL